MNTLSEQAVQPGIGKPFTYFFVGRPNNETTTGSNEEDDDYYYADALPVYSRPTHPTTTKKVEGPEILSDSENSHFEYDEYDDPLPVYSRPESATPRYPLGEDFEESLPTYSSPPVTPTKDYFYDNDDVLPVYSKPLPTESTTVKRVEEATTTRPDVVFPEISVRPGPEDPVQMTTTTKTSTEQGTTLDPIDETTPSVVFPSNTIRPIVEDPFATPRTTEIQ